MTKCILEDIESLGMFIKIPESLVQMLVCEHWKSALSVHKIYVVGKQEISFYLLLEESVSLLINHHRNGSLILVLVKFLKHGLSSGS